MNSQPDSTRGRRASLVIYDEAAFIDESLIVATLPFISQSSGAEYGANTAQKQDITPIKPPLQALYASSQDTVSTTFYKRFKEYAKYMIAGDRRFFCIDAPCDLAMTLYHKGEQIPPLLSKSVVESELKSNPEKAMREYYNKPDLTGGTSQIIKWNVLRNNERQIIPYSDCRGKKIVLAFDPARTADNSIVAAMELDEDPEMGICGNVIGCTNLIDLTSAKKLKLDSNRQLTELRNIILGYNGNNPDYEYLDTLQIDSGAGGAGVSAYSDGLLNDFTDSSGRRHRGLIDASNEIYVSYRGRYPDAIDKVRLVSPRKYRTQMVEEFIELMELGVIRFPYSYNGQDFLKIITGTNEDGEEILETYELSDDEKIHLTQIDLMKTEITSIHKSTNAENTSVQYALSPDKRNKLFDDRFYCMILLSHRLYELRRGKAIKNNRRKQDISKLVQFRAPKIF